MFKVRVPASTANLGSGFDCMGIALGLYSEAEFEKIESGFEIETGNGKNGYIPTDKNNLVYKSMMYLYAKSGKKLDGVKVKIKSDVPVTRGLGSSSCAIVMGLIGANKLLGNLYSKDELMYFAYKLEGHPDNVTPAMMGGFNISFCDGKRIVYSKTDVSDKIKFAAMMPDFYLSTRKSRKALPSFTHIKNASYNISHASMLAASFAKGETENIGICLKDRIHQKYRFPFIKSGEYIIRAAKRLGALGGYISGAGPTIMNIVCSDAENFETRMNSLIKTNLPNWHLVMLKADNEGVITE